MTVTVASGLPSSFRSSPASAPTVRDAIISAAYHWRLIATILLLAVAAGALAWALSPVLYTARSQILVMPERGAGSPLDGAAALLPFDNARATQAEVELIRDRGMVRLMVERIGAERLNPAVSRPRLFGLLAPARREQWDELTIDVVSRSLAASAESTSNLVTVTFEHRSRDLAITAVDTLIDVYLERRADIFRNQRSPFLRARAETYLDRLREVEAEIAEKKAAFKIINLEQDVMLALRLYDSVVQRRQVQLERREAALAQVASTERRLRELPRSVFDYREKTDKIDNDETDNLLTRLRLERDTLRLRYQDTEPRLAALSRQIQILQDLRTQPRRDALTAREVRNPTLDVLTNNLHQKRIEADAATRSVAELDRQTDEAQSRIDDLRLAEGTFQTLERSRQMLDLVYREASQRAELAQFEEAAANSRTAGIRVVDRADASLRGRSNGPSIAAAAIVGGIILAGVLTVLASWNRGIFLLPEEVARVLGLPVLASFGDANAFSTPEGQGQLIYLASQLALTKGRSGSGSITIQVVSHGKAERRAGFAGALAAEMAEGQNKRVLLLDLDGDGTRQWTRFRGTEPVPAGDTGLLTAQTAVPRLHVSHGASTGPVNWVRIDGQTLKSILARLRTDYEMIIVDTPPARETLVALRLAKAVEGSILVVRAEHTRTPVAARLRDRLLEAGGDLFGAVVTGRKFLLPRAIYRWL